MQTAETLGTHVVPGETSCRPTKRMPTSTEGLPEDSVMRVDKVLTVKGARIVRRPVGKLTPAKICELHGAIGCALDIQY